MTTVGTPIERTSTVTSTETSTTNRRGACVATHAEICAIRSRKPACPLGAQCNAPPAVSPANGPSSSRASCTHSPGQPSGHGRELRPLTRLVAERPRDRRGPGDVPVALMVDVVADHTAARASAP